MLENKFDDACKSAGLLHTADWIPFGIGAVNHLYNHSKENHSKTPRLDARSTLIFLGYSAYQIGSLFTTPLLLKYSGIWDKFMN
ncbi:MAG: hypothetical protein WCK29_04330 [archaeon]